MGKLMAKIADVLFGRADISPVKMSPEEFAAWKRRQDERLERVKQEARVWART